MQKALLLFKYLRKDMFGVHAGVVKHRPENQVSG